MSGRTPIVAIIGRTNVGKSTLFNAITARRKAVVEDQPGVTRDRNYAFVTRFGQPFTLIDTGGLVGEEQRALSKAVRDQAEVAVNEADVVIALFDGIQGLHPHDAEVVDLLRRSKKEVIWVINKCESPKTTISSAEFYSLGVSDLHFVSAAHKRGIKELAKLLNEKFESLGFEPTSLERTERGIRVAVLGRPNVGKSTLINKILGEERLVTSPIAGTTTDSIDIVLKRDGRHFTIVDTAGLRKRGKVDAATVERFANLRALKTLAGSDVAVLVLDASEEGTPTEQELKIVSIAHERGKGIVVVVNKWDAIEKDDKTAKYFKEHIKSRLGFASYASVLFVSAKMGTRCPSVLKEVNRVYENAATKVKTPDINRILSKAFEMNPPPIYRGAPVKLNYVTQIDVQPPTFVLFLNNPNRISPSYERYLKRELREHYGFEGSDIKFVFKKKPGKQMRFLPHSGE